MSYNEVKTVVHQGKVYALVPEGPPGRHRGGCEGCAFDGSINDCLKVSRETRESCAANNGIWKEVTTLDTICPPDPTQAGTPQGRKDDSGKLDITLLFDDLPHALEAVTEVLQWAITKKQPQPYERGSWQGVEDFQRRYRAAQLRHMLGAAKAAKAGTPYEEARDHETGLLELAHIATDALFQLEKAIRAQKGIQ